jgi:hypothetical protein
MADDVKSQLDNTSLKITGRAATNVRKALPQHTADCNILRNIFVNLRNNGEE